MINDVQWFVGIDWATQSHCVCLLDAEGRRVGSASSPMAGPGWQSCVIGCLRRPKLCRDRSRWRSRRRTAPW